MNETLKAVLSLSLSGALLILLLFVLRPLFKERLSKRWQYYIWLVVVARLLLPFAPETNLMATFFQGMDRAIEQAEIVSPSTQQGGIADIPRTDEGADGQNNLHSDQTEPAELVSNPVRNIVTAVWKNLWLGWLVVALILFIRKITVYQDFVKYIRAGCVEVADIDLLERFGKLIERNKVKTTVELYTNNLISSPLLLGFFRPSIVLPSADLSPVDFEYTILHELTHYKRRDMFYKWLVQFSTCVHWFNPLVYLMSREVGRACELSCDETVIQALDLQGRRAYGDTLLNAMGPGGNYKDSIASVTLNESKELLKERLNAIMSYKKKSVFSISFALILTILICSGATFTGVYAASSEATGAPYKETGFYTGKYFFENSYVIKMDWNIIPENYPQTAQLDISGKSYMIAFNENTKKYAESIDVIEAIRLSLLSQMESYQRDKDFWKDVISPAITEISGPYDKAPNDLAYQFYEENNLHYFRAILPYAQQDVIIKVYEKAYQENNTAFIKELLSYIPDDEINSVVSYQSVQNDDAFRVLVRELSTEQLTQLAEQLYQADDVGKFKILAGDLPTKSVEIFAERAYKDNKTSFLRVLINYVSSEKANEILTN